MDVNGKEFSFFVTPLTAAERERALKEAVEWITPANAVTLRHELDS